MAINEESPFVGQAALEAMSGVVGNNVAKIQSEPERPAPEAPAPATVVPESDLVPDEGNAGKYEPEEDEYPLS